MGSDAHVPGHGLLEWQVDPERAELGAWNNDERRAAVQIVAAGASERLLGGRRSSAHDPFPGESGQERLVANVTGGLALSDIVERDDRSVSARVATGFAAPMLRLSPTHVRVTARADGAPLAHRVTVVHGGDAIADWTPRTRARWLRVERDGADIVLRALPSGLAPGLYGDTVHVVDGERNILAKLPVSMYLAAHGLGQTVATELPWSWGLAVGAGRILQASYGWDPLGLRPRPRLLSLQEGRTHPTTLARLPADALYAPVLHADGSAHVLARTRGRNLLFHVAADGTAELIVDGIGDDPAYGMTMLPDGDLLVSEWSGRLLRVRLADRSVAEFAKLPARIYQIASDGTGTVYAANYDGSVISVTQNGDVNVRQTGFGIGRLVALTATPDGTVFAAERGDQGRIVELRPNGTRQLVFRRPGAEFYGLALARDHFIYALDLAARELLRFPLDNR